MPEPHPDSELVERLYDVAIDPMRIEDLMEAWEGHAFGAPAHPSLDGHVSRAQIFLDRYDMQRGRGGQHHLLGDDQKSAAFLVDGAGGIVAANRAFGLAFAVAEGAVLQDLPLEADDIATLTETLRRVLAKGAGDATLRLRSASTASPVIMRLSVAARGLALVQSTELVWPERFGQLVQQAFALTAAEVEIVRGISMGQSVRDIAEARGRSVETVRTQLRSIMAKTETRSQPELLRVVLGLMDIAGGDAPADRLVGIPFQTLRLQGGRRLDWIEFGDPQGAPVLFTHLDYGLTRWPVGAELRAAALGIRVIVPVRAGYGASDPHPRGIDHLAGVTADYAAVLDHLGIARAAVIAQGADLRFAMNLSIIRPGLISGIVGCAAQLPLRRRAQYDRMDRWQRFTLANARYAPKILPFWIHAAFMFARRKGKDAFFLHVNAGSPPDMAMLEHPETREALLLGSEICLSRDFTAHEAFTLECIGSERDWSSVVHACKVPVLLLQADQDPRTPLPTTEEYRAEYPALAIEVVRDTGQLLFFQKWEMVLGRIGPMLPR